MFMENNLKEKVLALVDKEGFIYPSDIAEKFASKLDYSLDNVRDAQIVLAENSDELIRLVQENKLDRLIDEYD